MNWLRDNPFLAGLAAATILSGSALIFLSLQAMGRFQETTEAYAQAVQKLHTLQNRSPFPNVENLEKSQALKIQYVAALETLRGHLERMQTPAAPGVSPQKFQDDPHWRDCIPFHEYFHGDNGAGLGASHQTGWTALAAVLAQMDGTVDAHTVTEFGRAGAIAPPGFLNRAPRSGDHVAVTEAS
jgi:hypothetical protein